MNFPARWRRRHILTRSHVEVAWATRVCRSPGRGDFNVHPNVFAKTIPLPTGPSERRTGTSPLQKQLSLSARLASYIESGVFGKQLLARGLEETKNGIRKCVWLHANTHKARWMASATSFGAGSRQSGTKSGVECEVQVSRCTKN